MAAMGRGAVSGASGSANALGSDEVLAEAEAAEAVLPTMAAEEAADLAAPRVVGRRLRTTCTK